MAAKKVYGRWGMECGCDYCQVVYRICLLCMAPKRAGAFSTCEECNWIYYTAPVAEQRSLMTLMVSRSTQRVCETTGRRW
jgi:hypothetical protein